jgi:hypothetical protein
MTSQKELLDLYRIVINLNRSNDEDFGFSSVSREEKFIKKFGSEKQFLKNLGGSRNEKPI